MNIIHNWIDKIERKKEIAREVDEWIEERSILNKNQKPRII